MIITENYVFLHIPRTGGMWVVENLRKNKLVKHWGKWHQMLIPEEFKHLPKIAVKRDPLDWYPSWFEMMKDYPRMDYYLHLLSDEREDLNKFVRDCWRSTRDIKKSPLPHLAAIHQKGPLNGYYQLANPDIWWEFDKLEDEFKEYFGDMELLPKLNAVGNKQKLNQSSKIFIRDMEL